MSSSMNMKFIKNNAFFIGNTSGQTSLSYSTSGAKLSGTSTGLTLNNTKQRNCAAMLFTSVKGCSSCSGTK